MQKTRIDFIGCGNMAGAMLSRWLECQSAIDVTIIKPTPPKDAFLPHVRYINHLSEASPSADIVLMGVKPQMMRSVLPDVVAHYGTAPLYVTMAAGLPHAYYTHFSAESSWLRIMPNTPVAIGQGVISCYMPENMQQHPYVPKMQQLLAELGTCCWLEDEELFDVATAIAGSGPAYAYLFMDALMQAGQAHGLSAELARTLATHMMKGAAAYATSTPDSLQILRQNVTSKGGTTAAALEVFMTDDVLQHITQEAIDAAVARAKELAV